MIDKIRINTEADLRDLIDIYNYEYIWSPYQLEYSKRHKLWILVKIFTDDGDVRVELIEDLDVFNNVPPPTPEQEEMNDFEWATATKEEKAWWILNRGDC